MAIQFTATITRASNGSVAFHPVEPVPGVESVVVQTIGTPSAKDYPVGSVVTISIAPGGPVKRKAPAT